MKVSEVVLQYLQANGFDGLSGDGCGCGLDDLFPCDGMGDCLECVPARKEPCCGCGMCDSGPHHGGVCYKPAKPKGGGG